ncbi:MAG: MFS transporter [Flavobacteriales bacterium]|nr:MFS transporter [Flavobacteriales bacterium]
MKAIEFYIDSYKGLSRPAWILACVILINRAGTMVLPFLSIYLREARDLDMNQVGIILSLFGGGALAGSLLGGWLTDKIGPFWVQTSSLVFGGICFLILKQVETFEGLAIGFFLTTVVTDSLRPANSSAVAQYTKPENLTRAYSLNRMATNLGFTLGPAIGGFLATKNYDLLFYTDACTCILAGLLFAGYFLTLTNTDNNLPLDKKSERVVAPWENLRFMTFVVLVAGYGTVFFQLFTTLPLFYREVYVLPENHIGWLLALNGLIVFVVEMPLVSKLGNKVSIKRIVPIGAALAGFGLLILNCAEGIWVLFLSMILLSASEILAMPFMTTYTVQSSTEKSRGRYLGMYSVGYSLAFIVAPALGTYLIDFADYSFLWNVLAIFALLVTAGMFYNIKEGKER